MSKHLRIRLLLVIAACVVGAGVASATIQRSASNADFEEYQDVTAVRIDMLAQDAALQELLHEPSDRALTRFNDARHAFDQSLAEARSTEAEAHHGGVLARQQRLADEWSRHAGSGLAALTDPRQRERAVHEDSERPDLLQAFLASNAELLDELEEERRERQDRALWIPIGLIALLTLLSGALLWVGVERPARSEGRRREEQDELAAALQVSRSEPEAYDVLSRHLSRSTTGTQVTILNRNNSADRLEPVTPVRVDSAVAAGLEGASPDSCLAIRMAGAHKGAPGDQGLLSCEVCGKSPERTTCLPSLVGGEVIGSVLVEHPQPFDADTDRQIADSVAEAAPVIANLRNLAIAEMRAATDGLTGLPNQRAVHETLKRMVAQAGRTMEPLGMVLFDLDRFKAINDTFGHGRGDDVLAAVGDVVSHTIRGSDFVGRLGGEEFAVLLPGTGREGALRVAENLREAIGGLAVAGIDRSITASFGVAVLPDDAPEAQALLRIADRALYQAKANGRDRVEMAAV
jgi:diguanylate cyclase (GGDEF)-like protein